MTPLPPRFLLGLPGASAAAAAAPAPDIRTARGRGGGAAAGGRAGGALADVWRAESRGAARGEMAISPARHM